MVATSGMEPLHARRRPQAAHYTCREYRQVPNMRLHPVTHHPSIQPPYILYFSLFMICAGMTLPRTSGRVQRVLFSVHHLTTPADYSLFYYFLLWFSMAFISVVFIVLHGIQYVSWPRLQPPTDIIYYEGPGYRSGHKGKGLGLPALDKLTAGATAQAKMLAEQQHQRVRSKRLNEIEMGTKERVD